MKSLVNLVAILLIVCGIVSLAYKGFTYTTQDKVAQLGSVQITAENQKSVYFPPILGAGAIVIGVVLLALGNRK